MAKKRKLDSQRADGRGHWPAGKRRSDLDGRTRRRVIQAIERAQRRDGHSLRSIARTIGVTDRTVRRWLSGERWPDPGLARIVLERLL